MLSRLVNRMVGLVVAGLAVAATPAQSEPQDFQQWTAELREEALARGIRAATFDAAFAGVEPIDRVIELDQRQPEFTQTFWRYLEARVTDQRVERARQQLAEHRRLLEAVHERFGVQPRFLVAFWALESNFGDHTGDFPLVASLATLAYDQRRSAFFRDQLIALLGIIDQGDIPVDVQGSWAGAMGQTQFIPTTYRDYAVDFDGDGRRDLWNSLPDVFASSANFLRAAGWEDGRTWGREVHLPPDFNYAFAGLETQKVLAEWQQLGVRDAYGKPLPGADMEASLILPAGATGGPAFLIYRNFRAILAWNRSMLYAIAVGHLADRIDGQDTLVTPSVEWETPLSRSDVIEIQYLLTSLGYDAGDTDGVVGPKTRQAIKTFQQSARLPADGYPTLALLARLRLSIDR